jgi:hypothetical protein
MTWKMVLMDYQKYQKQLKIGRHIVYKKDWINNFLQSNTRNSNVNLVQVEKDAHAS